jgi:hypothetical protein
MKNLQPEKILMALAACGLLMSLVMPAVTGINDLDKQRLKGKVKSVMEIKYALAEADGVVQKDKILYMKYTEFDIVGYETKNTLYQSGSEFLTSRFISGPDGRQLEMNEYNPDGTLNLNVTYNYNEKGFRSQALYRWAENRKIGEIAEHTDYYYEIIQNDIFTKVIYMNEYRGYCTEEHYLKADSTLSFKIVARYDFRGNKTESGYFHGSGRLSWMTKYTYDRYDNLIESRVFKSNRIAVRSLFTYEFDSAGNWVVRHENRQVYINILTAGLERANTITERTIKYY